jgi:predicted TIM-barrel fold metal-dependent hydrolase
MAPPEYNVTGIDYAQRSHLTYRGPIIDFHAHVMVTRPGDQPNAPPTGVGPGASAEQAQSMIAVGKEFGVRKTLTMCHVNDIPMLKEASGADLLFNGMINKKPDEPDDVAYRLLDRFLELGARAIKFWSAPRGRDRGLVVDAPWRIEAAKRFRAAGGKLIMVHVGDPDSWFRTVYTDSAKYGTKPDQYVPFERMLQMFPDMTWIGAHMGGDPEHPDHLQTLLEKYPYLHFDTSATKWQVREVSPRHREIKALVEKFPDRFLWGTDEVTRHGLAPEHYASRYWCQRTLWESTWTGDSPIADPDVKEGLPRLEGVGLSGEVLEKVYWRNAARLLELTL